MVNLFSDFGFESSAHKSSSFFSFAWIHNSDITRTIGLCVMFKYKMSNSRQTELSLSTITASGIHQQIWKLFGVHGGEWHTAWVHLSADEKLKVCLYLIYIFCRDTM